MNDQDKAFARQALERKELTIEQVEQIRAEVDRTGRSFREVAAERGLLPSPETAPPPEKKIPTLYVVLLGATLLIILGVPVTVFRLFERSRKDVDLALETERNNAEAERKAAEARRGYNQALVSGREAEAREHLAKARAAMARVETMLQSGTLPPGISPALNDAFVGYNMYLKVMPDDAAVCVERAKTHELRRNYDLAIADLEHAMSLQPELEPALKTRIAQLRLFLSRKPQ